MVSHWNASEERDEEKSASESNQRIQITYNLILHIHDDEQDISVCFKVFGFCFLPVFFLLVILYLKTKSRNSYCLSTSKFIVTFNLASNMTSYLVHSRHRLTKRAKLQTNVGFKEFVGSGWIGGTHFLYISFSKSINDRMGKKRFQSKPKTWKEEGDEEESDGSLVSGGE